MRHVDDGILHAYLDGALAALADADALPQGVTTASVEGHLRTCPDCRALLERERALRGEADVILGDAASADVEVPPFELLHGQPRAVPTGLRRALPLAWAASLLLALGAGWWGSSAWRAAPGTDVAAAPEMSLEGAAGQVAGSAAPETVVVPRPAGEPPAPVARDVATPVIVAAPVVPGVPAAVDSDVTALMADRIAAEVAELTTALPAPVPAPVHVDETAGRRQVVARLDTLPAERNQVRQQQGTLSFSTLPVAPVGAVNAQRSVLQLAPPPPRQGNRAAGEPLVRIPLPVELFREAVAAARTNALAWQPGSALQAGNMPLLMLEGAASVEVASAVEPSGGELVRLRHRMPDGSAVELLQWRDPDAVAPRTAPAGAVSSLIVSSGESSVGGREILLRVPTLGLYLLITADLEPRQLVALADALVVLR